MTQSSISRGGLWVVFMVVLVVFTIAAIPFARLQNIWVDETTQLSGLILSPGELLAWLSGSFHPALGVPPDRMPPLSYFIDQVGWAIWGANDLAFRLYHAAITAAGLLLLMAALARRFSLRAALIAGLLLALSPKLITVAVEIRAYPILLALSCAQLALVIIGDVAAKPRRLVLFLLLGVLSGYTHFFGLVATSAYTAAIFIAARDRSGAIRVVLGYVLLLILWSGLIPFIVGASAISSSGPGPDLALFDVVNFLAQQLASNAHMLRPTVALLYGAGAGLLILLGLAGVGAAILRNGLAARHDPAMGIIVAVVAGIICTLLAGTLVGSFNALAPRYSIWLLAPIVALLAVSADGAIGLPGRIARSMRLAAIAALAVGAVWGQYIFLSRADWLIHGPSRALETMIAQADDPVAVVHVGQSWAWGYFPLYLAHRDSLPQWLLGPDGRSVIRITQGGNANGRPVPLSALDDQATLLVSHVELKTYQDLRALKGGEAFASVGDLVPGLTQAGWQASSVTQRPGNFNFTGRLYQRNSRALAQASTPPAPRIKDRSE